MFSLWLLLSMMIVFLLQLGGIYFFHRDPLIDHGICYATGTIFAQPGRLLFHGWLHSTSTPWHVMLNGLGVLYLGRDIEKKYGPLTTFLVFCFGIIVGAIFWKLLPCFGVYPKWKLIGASAGVCALFTLDLLSTTEHHSRERVPHPIILLGIAFGFDLLCWIFGWFGFIAHTAHLGGLLAGTVVYISLHYNKIRKIVAIRLNCFWNSDPFSMNSKKIIFITIINTIILVYLGFLLWNTLHPISKAKSNSSRAKTPSTAELVQRVLHEKSFENQIKAVQMISPEASTEELQPLLMTLDLQWPEYQTLTPLQTSKWISTLAPLLQTRLSTRITCAETLKKRFLESNEPIYIRSALYIQYGNGLIRTLTELTKPLTSSSSPAEKKASQDPALVPSLEILKNSFDEMNALIDKKSIFEFYPLQLDAYSYLHAHSKDRFPYPTLEKNCLDLLSSTKTVEKIKIAALRALGRIQSPLGLSYSLAAIKQNPSIALETEILRYLSTQGDQQTIQTLSVLNRPFPDDQENLLRTIQAIREKHLK